MASEPSEKQFKVGIENWYDISPSTARFFFEQSEKLLHESIDISDSLNNRAYKLLSILIPIISTFLGFIMFTIQNKPISNWLLLFLSIASVFCLSVSLSFVIKIFFPKDIMLLGSEPKDLIQPELVIKFENEELQIVNTLLYETENYQDRISKNDESNERKIRYFKYAIYWILAVPVVAFIFAFIAISG